MWYFFHIAHQEYKRLRSHFISGGLNYYVLASKNKYNVFIVVVLQNTFAAIEVGYG